MTSSNRLVLEDCDTPTTNAVSGVCKPVSTSPSAWRPAGGSSAVAAGKVLPSSSGRPPATGHRQLEFGACACSTSSLGLDDEEDDAEVRVAWYSQHGSIKWPEGAWNI